MKRIIYILTTTFMCIIAGYFLISRYNTESKSEEIRIIAHFNKDIISGNVLTTQVNDIKEKNIRKLFARFDVVELQAAFTNRYNNEGFLKPNIKTSAAGTWQKIILKNNGRAEKLVAKLKNEKGVITTYIEKPMVLKPSIAPTDSQYGSQWHLNSTSSPVADIDAEEAWDINTGRNDVIIAVCDGGVDYTHPDLDPGNRSRVITGYDFGNNDNDPMDDLPDGPGRYGGHGTHIAGIIGAIPNNGQVAGVMWNCKIMPVKMVGTGSLEIRYPFGAYNWDFSTTAFPSDVADAIDYAVNNGAHVINLSYGFPDMGEPINQVILRIPLLHSAISNAYHNNVVIVAAMGNEFSQGNPTNYPAAFPEVIAVGNTQNTNPPTKSVNSSTGSHICVSAPGTEILSTIRGGGTGEKSGTSMSAPVVSGVAGLIISQGMDRGFNLTNDDVRHIIERTAVDIGSAGFDNETGNGLVNAGNALQLLNEPNELFHYNSVGGTSQMIRNDPQWILLENHYGLAAGTYWDVDQYKITKHVTFDVPFCSPPQVWMRERQSACFSAALPNLGRPYSKISNVTNTGFDLEYYTYYVRTNTLGQDINQWIPAPPASTNVAYTAVGEPNYEGSSGPVSGPSYVCSTGSSFTVENASPGTSITWSTSSNITRVSAQGANPCVFEPTYSYGTSTGWIEATITTSCGNISLPRCTVTVNPPPYQDTEFIMRDYYGYLIDPVSTDTWWLEPNTTYEIYLDYYNTTGCSLSDYEFNLPAGFTILYDMGWGVRFRTPSVEDYYYVTADANTCCADDVEVQSGYLIVESSAYSMIFSPNPSSGETTVTLVDKNGDFDEKQEWNMEVYDVGQTLKTKKEKIKGNKHSLNVSNWKTGVYIVRAKVGDEFVTGRLAVE